MVKLVVSLPKHELKRRYNLTAPIYDKRYAQIQRLKHEVALSNLPRELGRVLDLGCGTGEMLALLKRRSKFVVGVDLSEGMLKEARRKNPEVALIQADADRLPFADQTFDAVVSITLLQNVPSPSKTLGEIARVLKLGGFAVVTSLKRKHPPELLRSLVTKANLKPIKVEEIKGSEDVMCIAVKEA